MSAGAGATKVGGSTDAVESVDDQYCTFAVESLSCRKNFRREALTTLVEGGYLIAAYDTGGKNGAVTVFIHYCAVVEVTVADTRINDVLSRGRLSVPAGSFTAFQLNSISFSPIMRNAMWSTGKGCTI